LLYPLCHSPRRLVGERHGEDPLRRDMERRNQVRYSCRQDAGLPRPRPSEDEQRTTGMLDRLPLGGIQGKWLRHDVSGNSSTNTDPLPLSPGRNSTRPSCCCSTIRRASARPIPQPPVLLETPGSNSWCCISGATPGPSSRTLTRARAPTPPPWTSIRPPRPLNAPTASVPTPRAANPSHPAPPVQG